MTNSRPKKQEQDRKPVSTQNTV